MSYTTTARNLLRKIVSGTPGSSVKTDADANMDILDKAYLYDADILPDTDNTRSIGSAIKRFLNAHFGQITLGGVTRSTWPASGSATVGLTDVLANGSEGNIPAGQKAAFKNSTGLNTWFVVEEGTGRVGLGTTSPLGQLEIVPQGNTAILRSLTGYAVTGADASGMIVMDGSWNTSAAPTLLEFNVVDYASAAGSLLLNLKVDGISKFRVEKNGNVGLGISPSMQLELSTSGAQKQSGSTWSNPSSELLKDIQGPADLQRCYDDTKALQLKRYRVKDDCFTQEAVKDRTVTGLVAEDVQKIIPKAVNVAPFAKVPIPDGVEEYEEKVENEDGMVETITKTRPKYRTEIIKDCLNLDMSQVYMQMLGAVQLLQLKVEALETEIITIKGV